MVVKNSIIIKNYSKALFEITNEEKNQDSILDELKSLKEIFDENPKLIKVLTAKNILNNEKKNVINILLKNSSDIISNLIEMLFDNHRIVLFSSIVDDYEDKINKYVGLLNIKVISTIKLTNDQKNKIEDKMKKIFKANKIFLNEIIDKNIIGGIIIHANNRVIDGSIATKLKNIEKQIVNNNL